MHLMACACVVERHHREPGVQRDRFGVWWCCRCFQFYCNTNDASNTCDTILVPTASGVTSAATSDYVTGYFGLNYVDRWCVVCMSDADCTPCVKQRDVARVGTCK